jgi:hypothetical protein
MRGTQYIPTGERSRMMAGTTSGVAVIGVTASVVACVAMSLSAALHIFGGFLSAPVLAENRVSTSGSAATTASPLWLALWNILIPLTLVAITLVTFRSWRNRENDSEL